MRIHLPHLLRTAAIILGAFLLASCARSISLDNLALLHPAYHSSAIDYNATAQLAVDGIIETQPARWVEICGNDGKPLSKIEHDIPLDPRPWTTVTVEGSQAELSLRTHGFLEPVDRVTLTAAIQLPESKPKASYRACLEQLDEAGAWQAVREFSGVTGRILSVAWEAPQCITSEGWRIKLEVPDA